MLVIAVSSAAAPGCFFTLADPVETEEAGLNGGSAGSGGNDANVSDGGVAGTGGSIGGPGQNGCELAFIPDASSSNDIINASNVMGIKIDGMGDDWPRNLEWHRITEPCLTCMNQDPIQPVSDPLVPGPSDLSARFRVGWDKYSLYVFVAVMDDDFVEATPLDVDAGDLSTALREDAIELMIGGGGPPLRVEGGSVSNGYGVYDRQMFIGIDNTAVRFNHPEDPPLQTGTGNSLAVARGAGCYGIEIKFSLLYLTGRDPIGDAALSAIGFTIAFNDWDSSQTDSGAVSERQSHLFSNDPGNQYWTDTGGFGTLNLVR